MKLNKSVYVKWIPCPKCTLEGALYAIVRESSTPDRYLYYLRVRHSRDDSAMGGESNYCYLPQVGFGAVYESSIPIIERKLAIPSMPDSVRSDPSRATVGLAMNRHAISERRRRWKWQAMSLPETIKLRIVRIQEAGASRDSAIRRVKSLYADVCERGEFTLRTAVRELSEPERAWIAGLIDGEGSIVRPVKSRTSFSVAVRVEINNNSIQLLNRVRETVGAGTSVPAQEVDFQESLLPLPALQIRRLHCIPDTGAEMADCEGRTRR